MSSTAVIQKRDLYFGVIGVFCSRVGIAAVLQNSACPSLPVSGLGFWDCTMVFHAQIHLYGAGDGGG